MKLDHISILVSSLGASMPYYDTLLPMVGMHKLREHVWTDGNGFHFQFLQATSDTAPYERYGAGMNHLGFGATSAEEVHAIREAMLAAGFPAPDTQNLGGSIALFMKDPDGIRFEITWYPPGQSVVD